MVAWTVTEIIRYSFYTFSLLNHLPYLIKWARWSFSEFIVWLCLVETTYFVLQIFTGTRFFSCCTPWEWQGNFWPSTPRCHTCRKQGSTPSPCLTSTTSPSTTTPSSSSSWSPTSPVRFNQRDYASCFEYLPSVNNLISRLILCIFEISRSSCLSCEWTALFLLMTIFVSVSQYSRSSTSTWCARGRKFWVTWRSTAKWNNHTADWNKRITFKMPCYFFFF